MEERRKSENNLVLFQYFKKNNITNLEDIISILDDSYDGIILSDKSGFIFYVNRSLGKMHGIDREYFFGKKATESVRDGLVFKYKKHENDGTVNTITMTKDGRFFLATTVPVSFKKGIIYFTNYKEMLERGVLKAELLETEQIDIQFNEGSKELAKIFSTKEIVVNSPEMRQVTKTILKISKKDVTVLLTGKSGVGKDVFAKLIHFLSDRKGPLIQINCGSLPENLLESELFGYSEGSFTGAVKRGKIGLLESANNGTVFLDEIADMPLNLQVKLLNVLQYKEIYRIGGREPIKLNLRIICATNRNIEKMVAEEKFREDLYFRINMITIPIPSLSERKSEILHLSRYFLDKFNRQHGTNKYLDPEVCSILEKYLWPGNIRELKNLIERLVVISDKDRISIEDLPNTIIDNLPKETTNQKDIPNHKSPKEDTNSDGLSNLKDMLNKTEQEIIKQAVSTYGSRNAAAKLGIDYSTLKRKLKKGV